MSFRNPAIKTFFLFLYGFYFLSRPLLAEEPQPFDYIIKGAMLYDGFDDHAYKADVAILGDAIAFVGDVDVSKGREVIHAEGLILMPGFIDVHTHSDFNPWVYPDLRNKISQGVTTQITGNCGMSAAPLSENFRNTVQSVWAREGVELPEIPSWSSFKEYKERMVGWGLTTNYASLVGHGNLRFEVMASLKRPPDANELQAMKNMLQAAMQEGALGLSFGLVYLPGKFASADEVISLCEVVKRFDGVCAFHMRSEGASLEEAVAEVLTVAEQTGVKIQISHLKAGGTSNWHKMPGVLKHIEETREKGTRVYADAYPYTAGYAELGVILPDAYYEKSDRLEFLKNPLHHSEVREALRKEYQGNPNKWDEVLIGSIAGDAHNEFEGKTIREVAAMRSVTPEQAIIDLLVETEFKVSAFYFSQSDDVVRSVLSKKFTLIGSDSIADGTDFPHPRAFGTFPKVLLDFSGSDWTEWGSRVAQMTRLAAEHFNLLKRGGVREGYFADLVLIDPRNLSEGASYLKPTEAPLGIEWVFVNGQPVIREGQVTDLQTGRVIDRYSDD